jgi:hypothetical protein
MFLIRFLRKNWMSALNFSGAVNHWFLTVRVWLPSLILLYLFGVKASCLTFLLTLIFRVTELITPITRVQSERSVTAFLSPWCFDSKELHARTYTNTHVVFLVSCWSCFWFYSLWGLVFSPEGTYFRFATRQYSTACRYIRGLWSFQNSEGSNRA